MTTKITFTDTQWKQTWERYGGDREIDLLLDQILGGAPVMDVGGTVAEILTANEPGVCRHCAKAFTPSRSDARYCSGRCRTAASRARRR